MNAWQSADILRRYIERNVDDQEALRACDKLLDTTVACDPSSPLRVEIARAGPTKRKQTAISLETKMHILEAAKTETNQTKLATQFDLPRTTIRGILEKKDVLEAAVDAGGEAKRKRLTAARHPELDSTLLTWAKLARSKNINLTGDLLKV
jgi:hypothetical protein